MKRLTVLTLMFVLVFSLIVTAEEDAYLYDKSSLDVGIKISSEIIITSKN